MQDTTVTWRRRRIAMFAALAVGCVFGMTPIANAGHISTALDVDALRTALASQGYLAFAVNTLQNPVGSERTGWTDIRHPANDGTNVNTTNASIGYDRSDRWIQAHNKIVKTDNGAGGTVTANPNIPRDYDYANAAYAHIGLSVLSTGQQNVDHSTGNAGGLPVVTDPINIGPPFPDDQDMIQGVAANRQAAPVVNNYYAVNGRTSTNGVLRGVTAPPVSAQDGTMVFDNAANDTFAHELGHFLLDNNKFNNVGDTGHSPNATDLMAAGGLPRSLPDGTQKGGGNTAPAQPGPSNGNLGGKSLFAANVDTAGNGTYDQKQANAITASPYVQSASPLIRESQNGDRADFDWVEDSLVLEGIGGNVDNHPGFDAMVWQIGAAFASTHISNGTQVDSDTIVHDHGGWGELDLGGFTMEFFNVVDVISQIARYTDMDVDAGGNWSARESSLDYILGFSVDGQVWQDGVVQKVFIKGWTEASDADNYVARWTTDIEAKYVRILALTGDGHDGNTQIDAIVAGVIPAPASLSMGLLGMVMVICRRGRRSA